MKPSTRRNLRLLEQVKRNRQIRRDCPHPQLNDGICMSCGNTVDLDAYNARWTKKEEK